MSTEKWKNPGEYGENVESVQGSKNCPDKYRKKVESGRVSGKGRIRASTTKQSGQLPKRVESM